jgi:hypothetical protein
VSNRKAPKPTPACGTALPVVPRVLLLAIGAFFVVHAPPSFSQPPDLAQLAIIIDDLGDNLNDGLRVVVLPGPVACAILPHTPHAARLASEARQLNKEVLLHLPMETANDHEAGPGQLQQGMTALEMHLTLEANLKTVPHAVGVNNHMGSGLTQDRAAMETFVRALRAHGNLFFVDSRTSPDSVAFDVARAHGVPALTRQVFLDNERTLAAIETQFETLVRSAQTQGFALGIGHPYPETLTVLERKLPELKARQVRLVRLSDMLKSNHLKETPWSASSFPSPKGLKNSKP